MARLPSIPASLPDIECCECCIASSSELACYASEMPQWMPRSVRGVLSGPRQAAEGWCHSVRVEPKFCPVDQFNQSSSLLSGAVSIKGVAITENTDRRSDPTD
ncbi:hypothetical protein NBRC116590_17430 [Pelagimonas sp. KU-00592-HH]